MSSSVSVQPDYSPPSHGSGDYKDKGYTKNTTYSSDYYGKRYHYNPNPPPAPHVDVHNVTEHLDYHPDYYFNVSPSHCFRGQVYRTTGAASANCCCIPVVVMFCSLLLLLWLCSLLFCLAWLPLCAQIIFSLKLTFKQIFVLGFKKGYIIGYKVKSQA
jgi:hypothetical protein